MLWNRDRLKRLRRRYRDEGYDVIIRPRKEEVPPFLADYQVDMVATRGNEGVVVEIKPRRIDLSNNPQVTYMASVVNAQPGWKFDLVILEPETTVNKAALEAAEPSDEQLFHILQTADDLASEGYAPLRASSPGEGSKRRCGGCETTPNFTVVRHPPS